VNLPTKKTTHKTFLEKKKSLQGRAKKVRHPPDDRPAKS